MITRISHVVISFLLKIKNVILPEVYYAIVVTLKAIVFILKILFNTNMLLIAIIGLNGYFIYNMQEQKKNLVKATTFKINQVTLLDPPIIDEKMFSLTKQEITKAINNVLSKLDNIENMTYNHQYIKDTETKKLFELNNRISFTATFQEMLNILHELSKHIHKINQFNLSNTDNNQIKIVIDFSCLYYEDLVK